MTYCLHVCPHVYDSVQTSPHFLCMLLMAMARSFSASVVINIICTCSFVDDVTLPKWPGIGDTKTAYAHSQQYELDTVTYT